MIRIILILLLSFNLMYSAIMQTELKNGLWQLVAFNGNHLVAHASVAYGKDNTREVMDIADEYTTYLVKESNLDNAQLAYNRYGNILSTDFIADATTKLKSSIGIFAIKNTLSPSGKTLLKTNINSAVKLKIKNAKAHNANIPKYKMYIKGKNSPAIKIEYQGNYEGHSFRIKFGNETEDYITYFDYTKTFSNPVSLVKPSNSGTNISAYSANIRDIIDFRANDNNLSEMILKNKFEIKDSQGIYNKSLVDYASSYIYSVIIYQFTDGTWKIFNSDNKGYSNDFDELNIAKGYWIKIENELSELDDNVTQTALISRKNNNINDEVYKNLQNGWSILSFNDSYVRYAPTGVFIPIDLVSAASFGGVGIYAKSYANINDRDIISLNRVYTRPSEASRVVNVLSQLKQDIYGQNHKLRSVPAIKVDINGNEIVGIIVISDEIFELNTSGNTTSIITSIAGKQLEKLSNNNYSTIYGEYLNFMEINDLNGSEINATISIKMPKFNSSSKISSNLNDDNKTIILMRALNTLTQSATRNGETTPSTKVAGYLTTLDFNTNDDYSLESNMSHMLLSSGHRYYISDTTYNKVYKFNRNGKFRLISSNGNVDIDSGNDTNIAQLISAIQNKTSETNIIATDLGINSDNDRQFAISSTSKDLDILEDDTINLFEDISLTSNTISNAKFIRGSVVSVSTFLDLLNAIVFNREVIDKIGDYKTIIKLNNGSDGSIAFFNGNVTITTKVSYPGSYEVNGSITIPSDTTLDVKGDLNVTGGLVIRKRGKVIVGHNLNIKGELVIDDGGKLIVKGNGKVGGNAVNNGVTYIKGSLSATTTTGIGYLSTGPFIPDPTITTTTISIRSLLLDHNVSGIPVGLFDLKGQDFPSIENNLQLNPLPTLDFPISGGIIETMYNNNKKIKNIMTMDYSSSYKPYWKITDLTKDIDTLYGNSYDNDNQYDNDYQGIFHLQANKAYWVNLASVTSTSPRIKDVINLKDSKITMQSYAHFSNTLNNGISITQNHINYKLNIKFKEDNNFINDKGNNKDYYNVVATIKNKRYYLKRNGYYFSLNINDNDMPLKETIIGEKDEPIILEAYNGTGISIKEANDNAYFKIKYFKPTIPSFTWNKDNDLIIDKENQKDINNNISTLELYVNNISDIKSKRVKFLLSENNLSKNNDDFLKWKYQNDEDLNGGITVIKAVIKKQDINKQISFYSNIRAFLYAPLKKGHILETSITDPVDIKPYSYISKKILNKDNGVQLNYLIPQKNIKTLSMVYYPQGKEEAKSLDIGFGASTTMYLRINSKVVNQNIIGSIKYIPAYIGKLFYIYFNGKLYQGRFANDGRYSNDSNAYNLEGETISVDTFTNKSASQADNISGRVISGGQGI